MCLSNVTTTEPLIAEEDITVYKFVEKCLSLDKIKELVSHGDDCIAVIDNVTVNGKISIDIPTHTHRDVFICTDNFDFDGRHANDKLGYKYSWSCISNVTSVIVKGVEFMIDYRTIYQKAKVVIGETYKSKLIYKYNEEVNIGLHSYVRKHKSKEYILVQCVIPKGSKYFIGDYEGRKDSIASDTLKYVKIVEKNIFEKLLIKVNRLMIC